MQGPEEDEGKYQKTVGKAGKNTPMGYGPPTVHRTTFSFIDWAKDPQNRQAWEKIMAASNGQLTDNPFENPEDNFQMGDGCLIAMATMNMNKARRLGWTGYVDTIESIFEMYRKLDVFPIFLQIHCIDYRHPTDFVAEENFRLGLLPPMVVSEPMPLV